MVGGECSHSGQWTVDSGQLRVKWRVDSGQWTVESKVESGEWRVESGEWLVVVSVVSVE